MSATIVDALCVLLPTAKWNILDVEDYSTIHWLSPDISQPAKEEIDTEIARQNAQAPFDVCKKQAKMLLADTDWSEMPSVTDVTLTPHLLNVAEFAAYRAALRGFIINPVASPSFPTVPTAQWSS